MKQIIKFFTSKLFFSILGLLILSALIWFMGPVIKFGQDNTPILASTSGRLIAIVILLLVWAIYSLLMQLKAKSNNNQLVEDLQQAPEDIIQGQTSEEMTQMNERFVQALSTLKKLNFKGRGAKSALYELPWYIIIGPPGSGKTTALINSSLDFPLANEFGKGALQGVGGTRNCDWWFTNDAVLIDTAGRYTTQDSHKVVDSSAWGGFLKLLKKHRRRRPINGAIVAISLQDLMVKTEDERAQYAKTIRQRIDELMEKLEVRFPIYLMFTKCDLVSGFSEFFEDLGKEEREQVLGISLPDSIEASQAPDFAKISSGYSDIVKRLYERVLWRVHSERDVKRRSLIQAFPQQMENLQELVDSFVQQAFVQNRYKLQPYLRGVYFTSGTQDGTPIDRLMSSVSANFGFNTVNNQGLAVQGKSFFIGKMLKEVIFPESELVGTNRFYEKLIKWTQRVAYTTMAGVSATFVFFWLEAYNLHQAYVQQVQEFTDEYQQEVDKLPPRSTDIRTVLPALNALAQASLVFDQETENPWVKGLGMYDDSINQSADAAYLEQLDERFYPQLINYVASHLQGGEVDEALYNAFRVYVMFNRLDHYNQQVVREWFVDKWSIQFENQDETRQALIAHLDAFLATDFAPAELSPSLLSSTRQRLQRLPVAQRIYQRIKSQPEFSHKVNLLGEMGGAVSENYALTPAIQQRLRIPVLYTKASYDSIDFSADSQLIINIASEKWLLHDESKGNISFGKDDLEKISKKVKSLYLADYDRVWQRVYDSLNVKNVKDVNQLNILLSNFADPIYSPLLAVLNVTSTNTALSNSLAANYADDNQQGVKGKAASLVASKVKWTSVDKKYRDINNLLRETGKQPAAINMALMKLSQVQEMINAISLAPDPGQKAFELAKARYQNGAENAITALNRYAKNAPKPIKRWLTTIADETWRVVLATAHQHINNEWNNQVYQPYLEGIAGRYPIAKNAENDIALLDFVEFFKPGGQMDNFYLGYIKPFINSKRSWSNKSVDKYSLGLSSATLKQVKRALEIKNVLFRLNAEVPSLAFSLKPSSMPKNDVQFMLEVGEDRIKYSHGPKFWKNLNWSANDEQSRVRILFEDIDEQQHSLSFNGPWAWFRLLANSKLVKTGKSSTYRVTFSIHKEHRITYQIKAKSVKNPFEKQLLSQFKCPARI